MGRKGRKGEKGWVVGERDKNQRKGTYTPMHENSIAVDVVTWVGEAGGTEYVHAPPAIVG